jgi:hypothetical protein
MCEAAGVMSGQGKPCIAYGSEVGEMELFWRELPPSSAKERKLKDRLDVALQTACTEKAAIHKKIQTALPEYHRKLDAMGQFLKQYMWGTSKGPVAMPCR